MRRARGREGPAREHPVVDSGELRARRDASGHAAEADAILPFYGIFARTLGRPGTPHFRPHPPVDGAIVGLHLRDGAELRFVAPADLGADGTVSGIVTTTGERVDCRPEAIDRLVVERSERRPNWPVPGAITATTLAGVHVLFRNWVDQFE